MRAFLKNANCGRIFVLTMAVVGAMGCPGALGVTIFEEHVSNNQLDNNWTILNPGGDQYGFVGAYDYALWFLNDGTEQQAAYAAELVLPENFVLEFNLATQGWWSSYGRRAAVRFCAQDTAICQLQNGYELKLYSPDTNPPTFHRLYLLKYSNGVSSELGILNDANYIADDTPHLWTIDFERSGVNNNIRCYIDDNIITWDGGTYAGSSVVTDSQYSGGTIGFWNDHERYYYVDDIVVDNNVVLLGELVPLQITGNNIPYDNWPVQVGIPFPEGRLNSSDNVRVFNSYYQEASCQAKTLLTWPDGSIKWLFLVFCVDAPAGVTSYKLEYGHDVSRSVPTDPLVVSEQADYVEVDTGVLKFRVSKNHFSLISQAWIDLNGNGLFEDWEQCVGQSSDYSQGIYLDSGGTIFSSAYQHSPTVIIEENGPVRAVICIKGQHRNSSDNSSMLSYELRLYAYKGQSFVNCDYTTINEQGETFDATISDLRLVMPFTNNSQNTTFCISGDSTVRSGVWDPTVTSTSEQHAYLYQNEPNTFAYYKGSVGSESYQGQGTYIDGWASVQNAVWGLMGFIRYPWQQFPTSLDAYQKTDSCVAIRLWPKYSSPFVFDRGMAKTSQISFDFYKARSQTDNVNQAKRFQTPLAAHAPASWYRDTDAIGPVGIDPNTMPAHETLVENGYNALIYRQNNSYPGYSVKHWYGFKNWGDWFGESGGINWGNLEYDLAGGYFYRWLRTGERKYYDYAESAALHHRDVDVAQRTIISKYGAGYLWKGTMIAHCPDHTAGSTDGGHVFCKGICLHYLLTGDNRTKEVVQMLGDGWLSGYNANYQNGWGGTYNDVHLRTTGWALLYLTNIYDVTRDPNHKNILTEYYERAIKHKWEIVNRHPENFASMTDWNKETWNPAPSAGLDPTVFENVHKTASAGSTTSWFYLNTKPPVDGYYELWARVRPSNTNLIYYEGQMQYGGFKPARNPTYGDDHWSWQSFGVYYLTGGNMTYINFRGVNQSGSSFDFKVDEIILTKDISSFTPDDYIWLEAEDGSGTAWSSETWSTSPYAPTNGTNMWYSSSAGTVSEPVVIDFDVSTPRPERYRVLLRVRHGGGDVNPGSVDYQIRIDSGYWADTTTSAQYGWTDRWQWIEYPFVYLEPNLHTLEVQVNNKSGDDFNTRIDSILLTSDDRLELVPEETLWLQAENGSGWPVQSWNEVHYTYETPAPGGTYQYDTAVHDPGLAGSTSPTHTMSLNLSAYGDYNIWAKVRSDDSSSTKYQVRVDGGVWRDVLTLRLNDKQVWQWVGFGTFTGLSDGSHTLDIRFVNDSVNTFNAYVDSVIVTRDASYVPFIDAKNTMDVHRRGNYNVYSDVFLSSPQVTYGIPTWHGVLGLGLIEHHWRHNHYAAEPILIREADHFRNRTDLMFRQWGALVYRGHVSPDGTYYNSFHFDATHLIVPTLAYAYDLTGDINYLNDADEFLWGVINSANFYIKSPSDPIWGPYYGSAQSSADHTLWDPVVFYYLEQ
ncbi:MAG: hypothetical protein ABIG61_11240 [Planctomycetota bacterium]